MPPPHSSPHGPGQDSATASGRPPTAPAVPALPTISVVVPAFNNPGQLARCLDALGRSTVPFELIVVDDASTDAAAITHMRRAGDGYLRLERNGGPAVARNAGARRATGSLVAFIDSDVLVTPTTIEDLARVLVREPEVDACFGSYDSEPDDRGVVSTYRNLLHHHVHQTGPREASTFWAGCGAVRRQKFLDLGGYDERFHRPSIEDIELGMRLCAAGHRIRLEPAIQVKHLKRWRLKEMVRVDVTCRAIPWTHLLIERPGTGGDLNLARAQKLCVALVFLALASLPCALYAAHLTGRWIPWVAPLVLLAPVLWINRGFYGLLLGLRGPLFLLSALPLHLFYYLYGGLGFLWAHATHRRGRDVG
ncbi:MAG: glycosyltransferase [Planctomycetes bacterium]|nr:glycosyltransferase [Planctomycetota bacterium]